jgi:hypothetical protein
MPESLTTNFAYLAFNHLSGTLLAHGKTAAYAALQADQVAPEAPLKIILAGAAGLEIWRAGMTHGEAAVILETENEQARAC